MMKKRCWDISSIGTSLVGFAVDNHSNVYFALCDSLKKLNLKQNTLVQPYHVEDVQYFLLMGVFWDGKSCLYWWDYQNMIHQHQIETGFTSLFSGSWNSHKMQDGHIRDALFHSIHAMAIDKNGDLLIAESHNLRKINPKQNAVETVAGSLDPYERGYKDGPARQARFFEPFSLVVTDDNIIYVTDQGNHCIRKIKDGIVSLLAGIPKVGGFQDGSFEICQFSNPTNIVFDFDRNLIVQDANRLRKLDLDKKQVTTLADFKVSDTIISMTTDNDLNLYIATRTQLIQLSNSWRLERWLWLGHLKEGKGYCMLARLPKEMVKEITSYLVP